MLWIAGWRSGRLFAGFAAAACAAGSGAALFLLLVFLVIGPIFGNALAALPWALGLAVVVVGGLGSAAYLIWRPWAEARPSVTMDDETVTIRYPGLGAPLALHRTDVASIVFGPVGGEAAELHLWGRLVPANLSLVLRSPVATDVPPTAVRIGQYFHRLWCGGRPVRAIQLRLEDPDQAHRAFAAWLP